MGGAVRLAKPAPERKAGGPLSTTLFKRCNGPPVRLRGYSWSMRFRSSTSSWSVVSSPSAFSILRTACRTVV
jgi:hypothetical protein